MPLDQAIHFSSGVHNKGQAQAEYIQLWAKAVEPKMTTQLDIV